jgi:hypothetical protein
VDRLDLDVLLAVLLDELGQVERVGLQNLDARILVTAETSLENGR